MRLVDYGHTFSPAMEMAAMSGDTAGLLHGEAVNCDMALTTQVLFRRPLPQPAPPFDCSYLSAPLLLV